MAGKVPGAELTAVLVQTAEKAEKLQAELGCLVTTDLQELLSAKPAYVIESAGNGVVRQITVPVLEAGADLIVLSTSIFGESAFMTRQGPQRQDTADKFIWPMASLGDWMSLKRLL